MEGVCEGKSDIIARALNRFMMSVIIIRNNTMLFVRVLLKLKFDSVGCVKKNQAMH
jgi:hypothetical protein